MTENHRQGLLMLAAVDKDVSWAVNEIKELNTMVEGLSEAMQSQDQTTQAMLKRIGKQFDEIERLKGVIMRLTSENERLIKEKEGYV